MASVVLATVVGGTVTDPGAPDDDAQPGSDEFTALWYLCEHWDTEWGGETLFFDAAGDAQFVCSPRPGRLVLFDGAIRHAGRPPSRICYVPRYTFAIKLERVP